MPSTDPAGDELLNLANLHFKKRQAELDLEHANVQLNQAGRRAVPNVFAQLVAMKQKEDKRREQAQGQQQAQQPAPQEMMPPMVQTTGRPAVGSQAIGAAADTLANFVSGGSGIKTMGAPGSVANQGIGAIFGQQQPPPQPAMTPGINPAAQPPAQAIPVQTDLTTGQQWIRGLAGAAFRNPTLIEEAITGKHTIGYTSQEEQAAEQQKKEDAVAQPLAVLRSRMSASDPATAAQAKAMYQQHLDQIAQSFGSDAANRIQARSEDLYIAADEKRRLAQEDPKYQNNRLMFDLNNQVATKGIDSLTPQQRQLWDATHRVPTTTINLPGAVPTKENISKWQAEVSDADVLINQMNKINSLLFNPDGTPNADALHDAFTTKGQFGVGILAARDRTGLASAALSPEDRSRLDRQSAIKTNLAILNVPYMHKLIGATMSPGELERIDQLLANFQKSPTENLADLRELSESVGLAKLRYVSMINSPTFQGVNPAGAMPLSNVKKLAHDQAQATYDEFRKQGMQPAEAGNAVREAFRNAYGLNIDALGGLQPTGPPATTPTPAAQEQPPPGAQW